MWSIWHWGAERYRSEAARRETSAACQRLLEKLDKRLSTAVLLQEELRGELLRATAGSTADEMNPGRIRLALRRVKAQLEGAEKEMRQFAEETAKLAAKKKIRHGLNLLADQHQRELEAQSSRLDGVWQELAALEQQTDWLSLRWLQAVEHEAAMARQSQAKRLEEAEQARTRAEAQMREMGDALKRAYAQAERDRESLRRITLANQRRRSEEKAPAPTATAVVEVNTGWDDFSLYPPPIEFGAPPWTPPPPLSGRVGDRLAPYYSVPSYYDYGCYPRSRIVGYGVWHPRIVRIGPYLVVN